LDPNLYHERRVAAVKHAKASGSNLYPHKFEVSISLPNFVEKYKALPDGDHLEDGTVVSIAGRVYNKRASGTKLVFYDVQSDGVRIQVMADACTSASSSMYYISTCHSNYSRQWYTHKLEHHVSHRQVWCCNRHRLQQRLCSRLPSEPQVASPGHPESFAAGFLA
jgi:lysyl-tRNA synthetase class II